MELIKFFQTGGPFMYPILVVLALGLAISLERYLYINRTQSKTKKVWQQLVPMLQAQDFDRAIKLTETVKSPVTTMLGYGFSRKNANSKRDSIESAMEEGIMESMPDLEQRTHYLATFANIATLLGLLGTIIGLIQAFTAVAGALFHA